MAWEKGKPRPEGSGRKKGTPNKRTEEVLEILAKHKFNVIEELIELYHRTGNEDATAGVAVKVLTELASYVYPKRKAIEHSGLNGGPIELERGLRELPDEELLKLLPEAVTVLKKK